MKVAAQLYTVRDLITDPGSVDVVMRRLRDIGYAAVEVAGVGPPAGAGFEVCAAHMSLSELTDDLDGVVARCDAWDCRYVVVPSAPEEYRSPPGYHRLSALLDELGLLLRARGLALAYHHHDFELRPEDGTAGLEILFGSASREIVRAELDTYWLAYAGADPAEWLRRLSWRVPLVHLKDMAPDGAQAEVGEGKLDWPAILGACKHAGTEWLIVEQDDATDPLASLALSFDNLTRMLGEW